MKNIKKYEDFVAPLVSTNKHTTQIIKRFDNFVDIKYNPTKYNGNIIVHQIMEWLRSKLLEHPSKSITVPLETFFSECSVDKDKFLTFYQEMKKTNIIKNFNINIKDNYITFYDFRDYKSNHPIH